jgi:hypothetical protein
VELIYAFSALSTALSAVLISTAATRYLYNKNWRDSAQWKESRANLSNDRAWETFEVHKKHDFEDAYHDYSRRG